MNTNATKMLCVLMLLAMSLFLPAGCNVMVKSDMATKIDTWAVNASVVKAKIDSLAEAEVKTELAINATYLTVYSDAATNNLFTYFFGDAQVYLKSDYYRHVVQRSIAATSFAAKAEAGTIGAATAKGILAEELLWFSDMKKMKDGDE